jgi:hypothetical protein
VPFPDARGSLIVARIPPCLVEGPVLPLNGMPSRSHPRSPTECAIRCGGGGEFGGDLRLGQIVWMYSRW